MDCKHEWEGRSDGVVCLHCGLKLSPQEYANLVDQKGPVKKTKKKSNDNSAK